MNIDITKAYTTRNGLKVHLYEKCNGYIYGRFWVPDLGEAIDCWRPVSWTSRGICNQKMGADYDLIPVKQWRATYTCSKCGETDLGMYGHHDCETGGFTCDKKKDKMNIDITKIYQTRSGLPVRIYAVDGIGLFPVHGAVKDADGWIHDVWCADGAGDSGVIGAPRDLIPAKQWRAWKEGEGPKFFMARSKNNGSTIVGYGRESALCLCAFFGEYDRLHEDGTTTPCGVLE